LSVRVVRVLPDVAAVGRPFDYEVPEGWEADVAVGTRVRVPLHGRRVGGWVVDDDVEPEPYRETKRLAKLSGLGPPAPVLSLATWAAWRWAGPLSALLTVASPDRVVRELPAAPLPGPRPGVPSKDPLGRAATAALRDIGTPTLLRVPPAADLLAVVEAAAAGVTGPVLVLVPNVGWAERLRGRLARRGLPAAGSWEEAAAGWPVVVGSRGAAFAPAGRLGAAVVLDAQDQAYREERAPHFDASVVVVERARRDGAPCLLTSATPSVVQAHTYRIAELPRDVERAGWPVLQVIDRRADDPRTGLYSEELVRRARATSAGRFVAVLNRKGRARLLACAACGELARCEVCGRAVREEGDELVCAACGARRPRLCAACGRTRLKALRVGVSRVREELEALVGEAVGEVSGPDSPVPDTRYLVGTEAVLHRVRRAEVVAFLDFDIHLLAPRLSAGEESLGLLSRAGRLVGGRGQPGAGAVVVQTRMPDHEVLTAATAGNPGPFLERELAVRRELALPPFRALAELSGPGAAELAAALGLEGSALGDDRWLVRAADHVTLCDRLAATARPRARVKVVVDPVGV